MKSSVSVRPRFSPPRHLPSLLVVLLLFSGSSAARARETPSPTPDLDREIGALAAALAESIDARVAVPDVRVLDADGASLRISIGSRQGIRSWSTVVVLSAGARPWVGDVRDVDEATTWLDPRGDAVARELRGTPPPVGALVQARVNARRLGVACPPELAAGHSHVALAVIDALRQSLETAHGWETVPVAAFRDPHLQREVAARAGVDFLVTPALGEAGNAVLLRAALAEARRDHAHEPIVVSGAGSETLARAFAEDAEDDRLPLPGTHLAARLEQVPGALLDLFVRRWTWTDVRAVFDDRIETWRLSPAGIEPVGRRDLLELWPPTVGSRWPVATVLPVNTWYDMEGEESKVNYSICSNRRPRYLTLNIDRTDPESLWVAVGDGPLDSLSTASDGCFPKLDRVTRPADYPLPEGMPETARTRLALEEVLLGPAGVPMTTESGRLRMRKVAVVYYDEPSGAIWLSTPQGGRRIPGVFGAEMDGFREGATGAPGILVTDGVAPGEPDRLSWWVLENGNLVRRWSGPAQRGAITALDAADRDGDSLEDVVFGVVRAVAAGYVTDVHYLGSSSLVAEDRP